MKREATLPELAEAARRCDAMYVVAAEVCRPSGARRWDWTLSGSRSGAMPLAHPPAEGETYRFLSARVGAGGVVELPTDLGREPDVALRSLLSPPVPSREGFFLRLDPKGGHTALRSRAEGCAMGWAAAHYDEWGQHVSRWVDRTEPGPDWVVVKEPPCFDIPPTAVPEEWAVRPRAVAPPPALIRPSPAPPPAPASPVERVRAAAREMLDSPDGTIYERDAARAVLKALDGIGGPRHRPSPRNPFTGPRGPFPQVPFPFGPGAPDDGGAGTVSAPAAVVVRRRRPLSRVAASRPSVVAAGVPGRPRPPSSSAGLHWKRWFDASPPGIVLARVYRGNGTARRRA